MDRDWANLEALVLSLILDKLIKQIDHVWFGTVCKNWCSVAKLNHQNQQFRNNVLPMLMIPIRRNRRTKRRSLYDIQSNRVYHFQLSMSYHRRCIGSSHGWLATVDRYRRRVITLVNPFKDVSPIALPPINVTGFKSLHKYSHEYDIHKVILSADPATNPNDYVAVAIQGQSNQLAFIKAGQKSWTYVDDDGCYYITDVTIYKGLLYAVSMRGDIVSVNLSYSKYPRSGNMMMTPMMSHSRNDTYPERDYLVKSLEGDLWLIKRFVVLDHIFAYKGRTRFEVHKLELDAQNGKLLNQLKLESLGDNVLFLGDNESIAVSYFSNCLQKESIYYTDDYYGDIPISFPDGKFDMGIYNVKDGTIQRYPYEPLKNPPPIWVLPAFKWD